MSSLAAAPASSDLERDRLAPWLIRREDVAVALVLAIGFVLRLSTGTGFEWSRVFWGYLGFFAQTALYLFVALRLTNLVRARWRPSGRLGRRLVGALGGPAGPEDFFRSDVEFLRFLGALLLTLTIYTNVEVRVPFINETVGDDFFQALDNLLLGERLVPWIERTVAASPWLAQALTRICFFGYVWMVLLILWFWIRSDAPRMRWLFASFCLM